MAIINRLPWWLSGKRICLPMQEIQVQSMSREDPPEKEMATHSSILTGNPTDRGLAGYSPQCCKELDMT